MTTPWARYQQDLEREGFSHDPSQEQAVKALQKVFDDLIARDQAEKGMFGRLSSKLGRKPAKVKGLYFWGGVGRLGGCRPVRQLHPCPSRDQGRSSGGLTL